jgi:hypothetical protein
MSEPMDYEVIRDLAVSSLGSAHASLQAANEALRYLIDTKRLPTGAHLGSLRQLAVAVQHDTDSITDCLCV